MAEKRRSSPNLTPEAYEALRQSAASASAQTDHRVSLSERILDALTNEERLCESVHDLVEIIGRASLLHTAPPRFTPHDGGCECGTCHECHQPVPCSTIRALNGATDE